MNRKEPNIHPLLDEAIGLLFRFNVPARLYAHLLLVHKLQVACKRDGNRRECVYEMPQKTWSALRRHKGAMGKGHSKCCL